MARPRATEEQREAQRRKISRAAQEIYDEEGVGSVSIRGVASRAGVSQGLIYSYFADRGELLRSLWQEPVVRAGRRLESLAGEIDDPVERIRALLAAYVEFAITHPDVHRNAMLFVRPGSRERPSVEPPDELAFFRLVVDALNELADADGSLAGPLRCEEPRAAAELLWAAVHGALGLAINTDIYEISPAEVLGQRMVDLLLRAVLVPAAGS